MGGRCLESTFSPDTLHPGLLAAESEVLHLAGARFPLSNLNTVSPHGISEEGGKEGMQ